MRLRPTSRFSDNIAIDLGTTSTLIHVAGRGIIIDEPSVVATSAWGGNRQILAVGAAATKMVARTPQGLHALRPLRNGVISDFVATEVMLREFIRRAKSSMGLRKPRILVCSPPGATPLERRALYDTTLAAGAREVLLVEEPIAAAIGLGLPIAESDASMIVDIGGGTTDAAVMASGSVLWSGSLRCAGHAMDEAIVRHLWRKHHLIIGVASAERIKHETKELPAASGGLLKLQIRGRDLRDGRLKQIQLEPWEIGEALERPVLDIVEFVMRLLDELPPSVVQQIRDRGIHLTGGGSLVGGLDGEMNRRTGITFHRAESPLHTVVTGAAEIMEKLSLYRHFLIQS